MPLTLHQTYIREKEPRVIAPGPERAPNGEVMLTDRTLRGDWLRVFPKTWDDISFLQMLEHQIDKFAPWSGGGVMVNAQVLALRMVR